MHAYFIKPFTLADMAVIGKTSRLVGFGAFLLLVLSAPVATGHSHNGAESAQIAATRCEHLAAQFDDAWPSNQDKPTAQLAYSLRQQGVQACQAGNYREGVHDLKHALLKLGINPVRSAHKPHAKL